MQIRYEYGPPPLPDAAIVIFPAYPRDWMIFPAHPRDSDTHGMMFVRKGRFGNMSVQELKTKLGL
jgi:hypothetical protein